MIDATMLGSKLAKMVKNHIEPFLDKIKQTESMLSQFIEKQNQKDHENLKNFDDFRKSIESELDKLRQSAPPANTLYEMPDLTALVDAALKKQLDEYLAALPPPQPGKDGKSVTLDDVLPALQKQLDEYLAALPPPQPGKDGSDGVGLAGALIDRDGQLVVTMTNGEAKNLGPVCGKDGEPGKNGSDGFGFDDLSVEYDGERSFALKFRRGEKIKAYVFDMPVVIDRGVYQKEKLYKAGDGVTWGGHYWIAQKDTDALPDYGSDWRLSVKRGRDGKATKVKIGNEKPQPVLINSLRTGSSATENDEGKANDG